MVLRHLIRDVFTTRSAESDATTANGAERNAAKRVLNVGGFSKSIPIPGYFRGWEHLLLDIDPTVGPDIVCDARTLDRLEPAQFDAVYCSHNLEHYYRHDVSQVLRGFVHVLRADGFAQVRVPDLGAVFRKVVQGGMDIDDELYVAANGQPMLVSDVVYGWGKKIQASGQEFFAHKTGFTPKSLRAALMSAGFQTVVTHAAEHRFEVAALAFKTQPTQAQRELLQLDAKA
jgi:ubiquinone/menaquinone biosynthesis C-methylase UbiE